MNVPKLRFSEFSENYKKIKLKNMTKLITKGTTPRKYTDSGVNFIKVENLLDNQIKNINSYISYETHNNELKRSILKEYDILFSIAGALGRTAIVTKEELPANTNQACSIIRLDNLNDYNLYYLMERLHHFDIKSYINKCQSVGAQPNLSLEQVGNICINIPNKKEQDRVGRLIELVNKKIELQTKKIDALKLFKSYTKSEIFKNGNHVCKLGAILNKWNKKNKDGAINYVESISNKAGFIPQSEQFEDRNVASKNLRNYYVIKKGVFGYNPSRLNVGSLALKENDFISVVSPLYECFTTTQNNTYLFEWFNSNNFKKETFSKFEGGVRNTLNFNNLCDIPINLPDIETQNQYAKYFNKINFKISLEEQKLSELVKFKKGLLQDMFI